MRSSSVRTFTLVLSGLVLAPALLSLPACGPTEQPAPSKVEEGTPFDRGVPKRERDPNSPFRDPATETPSGRDGDQVSAEEIEVVLAEAAKFAEIKSFAQERDVLRKCANKTPANARCDGQMGLSMIQSKNRRATAIYYLVEAAMVDDPKADAAMYSAIADSLRKFGRNDEAVAAMEKAVARDPSAESLFQFGQMLSLMPERLGEGADRMAEARAKDDRLEWLYEEAVVRGQIPVREQAVKSLALFKDYIARAESVPADKLPAPTAPLAGRIAELEELRTIYPTQAEFDSKRAAADEKPDEPASPKPEPS